MESLLFVNIFFEFGEKFAISMKLSILEPNDTILKKAPNKLIFLF